MSPDYVWPALVITQPLVQINLSKKTVYDSSYYLNCFALLFWVQNCRSQIAQVEYQGWVCKTRILGRKLKIDTSYRIRHRLELKLFHFQVAQFCTMHIEQLIDLEKVRNDNLKFRTDLRDRVMDSWSVTQ